ncbi:MAG: hypothetical protein J5483_07545 [Lachnospiraceae bacterium]|nr:hypothetical protein [Lachnospiraceae bacterium]
MEQNKVNPKNIFKNHLVEWIASLILGFLEVLSLSLFYKDSLSFWFHSALWVLAFFGLGIVFSVVCYLLIRWIQFLCSPKQLFVPEKKTVTGWDRKHPFLLSVIVLTVFYLPWIIAFYPGSAIYDMMYQIVQADGFIAINEHHPIFVTYVMGLCSKVGLALDGTFNSGIFIYIVLQTAVCILCFSAMLSYMVRQGTKRGVFLLVLGFFAIYPLWGGAMQVGTKDNIFMGLFVLFLVRCAQLMEKDTPFKAGRWIGFGVLIVLLCLYRNAILIILIPTLVVFFFVLLNDRKKRKWFVISALAALLIAQAFLSVTKNVYHTRTETGEILGIPFQQTARYIRDHGDEMTADEIAMVERTFSVDTYRELGELYYPMGSDPVKARYHWWATDEEKEILKGYVKEWFSMLKKHPDTYLEATIAKTSGYYSLLPVIQKQKAGAGTTIQFGPDRLIIGEVVEASGGTLSEDLIPASPESLKGAQEVLRSWYYFWLNTPVLNLFFKCGIYFLILLAVTIYYAKQKRKGIVLTIPGYFLILMAIASPPNEHVRYVLPVAAVLPLLICAAGRKDPA